MDRNEADLVERLKAKDMNAFEQFVLANEGMVYRVAFRITGDENDAQEITQDVFVTVFRKISGFKGDASLSSWIHRIAINAAISRLRTGKKHEHESSWEDYLPEFTEEGHHSELIDDWPQNPEDILLTEEAHTIIQNAIDQLPDDYRLVLILRDVEGLSNQETGDILRLGLGAVKSRLHRARLYLRGLLTEYLDESRK